MKYVFIFYFIIELHPLGECYRIGTARLRKKKYHFGSIFCVVVVVHIYKRDGYIPNTHTEREREMI